MARLVLEIISSSGVKRDLRVFEKSSVTIGRGYGNDLILPDPYIDASHALVRLTDEGIVIEDLNSLNGIYLLGERQKPRQKMNGAMPVSSGQMFAVGQTIIQIFHPDHPLAPSRRLQGEPRRSPRIIRPRDLWAALLGFLVIYFIDLVLINPFMKVEIGQVLFYELLILFLLSAWSGIWALVGRMFRHKGRFRAHLTMTCLFAIVMILISNAGEYLGYLFANPLTEKLFILILGAAAFTILLFGHMAYSTSMGFRMRLIAAAIVPMILMSLLGIGTFAFRDQFSPRPSHYHRVKPPILSPGKVNQIDSFLLELNDVFQGARQKSNT